jgi:hypothetical protein
MHFTSFQRVLFRLESERGGFSPDLSATRFFGVPAFLKCGLSEGLIFSVDPDLSELEGGVGSPAGAFCRADNGGGRLHRLFFAGVMTRECESQPSLAALG